MQEQGKNAEMRTVLPQGTSPLMQGGVATVLCNRRPSTRLQALDGARAWQFITGGTLACQQHDVCLSRLNSGRDHDVCSCGTVGQRVSVCAHVYNTLGHSRLLDATPVYLKPWQTANAWEQQLGKKTLFDGETALTASKVLAIMDSMQTDGSMQELLVPDLKVRLPGAPPGAERAVKDKAEAGDSGRGGE